jgi:hypothetical protein
MKFNIFEVPMHKFFDFVHTHVSIFNTVDRKKREGFARRHKGRFILNSAKGMDTNQRVLIDKIYYYCASNEGAYNVPG